jgi:cysteine protease ATG4
MSTSASVFRGSVSRSPSNGSVLATAPHCSERQDSSGAVKVEMERYETVDLPGKKNAFVTFLESNFGGESKKKATNESNIREMEDRSGTVKIVSPVNKHDVVGDFDICQEYNYFIDEGESNEDVIPMVPRDISVPSLATDSVSKEGRLKTHVLGRTYHPIHDYSPRRDDESSLFWFTYRCDFPEIAPYNITSDAGWGCMLRSAQMLLGQALRLHYKSRDWRPQQSLSRRRQDPFVRSMLTWFADFPSSSSDFSVYSLHNMVAAGLAKYDKLPGEWYGPGTACYVVRDLVQMHERQQAAGKANVDNKIFRVHVASQGAVYRDTIQELMTRDAKALFEVEKSKKAKERPPVHPLDQQWEDELVESVDSVEWDTALLLLIPLRLGLKSFNEDYVRAVAHTFSLPQSVGVLGGRPRGARWFYGALSDGSKILGLDPHTVQNAPRRRTARVNGKSSQVVELSDDYMRSLHTTYPEVFSLLKMDPSIALGFYCRNQADLDKLLASLKSWHEKHPDSPELFTVAEAVPDYSANVSSAMNDMMMSSCSLADEGQISDEDEYVML